MKKKFLVCLLGVMCCTLLASCGTKKGNVGKDPLTGEEMSSSSEEASSTQESESQSGYADDFDKVLNESSDVGGVVDYIGENIADATETDIRRFFDGLFHYGDDLRNIDFSKLETSKQYLPEDMIAFMELMKIEEDSPSMVMSDEENRRVIGLTLSEMLERALLFEQHIEKFPDHMSTEPASRMYEEIATQAITGGYDKNNGVEHYYQGDSPEVVDEEAIKYYQQFVDANPDSRLAGVVKEYIKVLKDNKFQLNEEVEGFYQGIYLKLFPNEI